MLIRDTARRLTRYRWVEGRLFEVLGRWSTDCADADVARLFAVQSYRHAWHAELWAERLPVLHDVGPEELSVPAPVADALGAFAEPTGTVERLAGLSQVVLPALLRQYRRHLDGADAVSDGPVIRALRLVTADQNDDWRAAEALLASVIRSDGDAEQAAAHQSHLAGQFLLAED